MFAFEFNILYIQVLKSCFKFPQNWSYDSLYLISGFLCKKVL